MGRSTWWRRAAVLLCALGSFSCDGQEARSSGVDATLAMGWIMRVVQAPDTFSTTVDRGGRDAWIAFHRNDFLGATTGDGAVARRAWGELAVFYDVLADLSRVTWVRLGDTWAARGGPPRGSVLPLLVGWAQNDGEARGAATGVDDPVAGPLMNAWSGRPAWDPPETFRTLPLGQRMLLHAQIRAGGADLQALRSAGGQPIHVEVVAEKPGLNRALFDPLLYLTLKLRADAEAAAITPPVDPLETQLFSAGFGVPAQDDTSVLAALGVALPAAGAPAESCRNAARSLDTALDGWRAELGSLGDPASRALLDELRLVEGLRARLLTRWAVSALDADQPACALAYAELALDHEHPREVTPINSPTLFAALASARMRTGNVRLALDALEALASSFPEVLALDETLGDLSVLQNLGKSGDSREN